MSIRGNSSLLLVRFFVTLCFLLAAHVPALRAQETQQKPAEKPVEKTSSPAAPKFPAQLSLLETRVRFEANGDSRKEVHTIVKINNELGVRQFARLNFDYNRAFEQIEIPLVRITHSSGGTADILPSAITDNPNPAVVNAPAYQDVRVKSVRILGLEPGDTLEYRVVTTISHPPFAPNFYLSHDFANDGLAARELFEVNLPSSPAVRTSTSRAAYEYETEKPGEGANARLVYRWERPVPPPESSIKQSSSSKEAMTDLPLFAESDVAITSFPSWADVLIATQKAFGSAKRRSDKLQAKAEELAGTFTTPEEKLHALYDFVAQRISTIDLPLGATGYILRAPEEILSSGYAVPEDKCLLLAALALAAQIQAEPALAAPSSDSERGLAIPSILTGVLVVAYVNGKNVWLDTSAGITPFGMIAANLRGKPALFPFPKSDIRFFADIPKDLPFAAWQRVNVDANIGPDGKLTVKVKYALRGDNELVLRVAFHQTPKGKWNDVAQLLSLSDGFRGKIISATASDPYATKDPFTVEYEIEQPKFVDWSKKPVRIPAILPLVALPDPPAKPAPGTAISPIDLGTPLDVETKVTLQLPPGTTARTPTGISVSRDYATFASKYSAQGNIITASRHINFLLREVPAAGAADYNAFVRAVQNDETQDFTLEHTEPATSKTNSATPIAPAPPNQNPTKP